VRVFDWGWYVNRSSGEGEVMMPLSVVLAWGVVALLVIVGTIITHGILGLFIGTIGILAWVLVTLLKYYGV
jgi:hypothetical protein